MSDRLLASELLDLRAYPLARIRPDSSEDFLIADGIVFSRLENEVPRSKLLGIIELKSEEF
jgi:hypothetical protein